MSDGDMAYRLRRWRTAIDDGRVYDAIDWMGQCHQLYGARCAAKALRHPKLLGRALTSLWAQTKALVPQRIAA